MNMIRWFILSALILILSGGKKISDYDGLPPTHRIRAQASFCVEHFKDTNGPKFLTLKETWALVLWVGGSLS